MIRRLRPVVDPDRECGPFDRMGPVVRAASRPGVSIRRSTDKGLIAAMATCPVQESGTLDRQSGGT
ncbi:MAG: hypothetical protein F4103_10800 [Boseongicola sp. SB0673_bin_14]|nr:hypothetical protein [Boseongicola sp. SB0673_bin_14]